MVCFIGTEFYTYSDIRQGFDVLTQMFVCSPMLKYSSALIGQCRSYCTQHWHDENLNSSLFSVSSITQLFDALKSSPFYNFLNPRLLKHLAIKSTIKHLIDSVRDYEETYNSVKLQDLSFIREVKVTGDNIPEQDHGLVVSAMQEQGITIGQLQGMCTPRYLHLYDTVILDFGIDLPDFYHYIKVTM